MQHPGKATRLSSTSVTVMGLFTVFPGRADSPGHFFLSDCSRTIAGGTFPLPTQVEAMQPVALTIPTVDGTLEASPHTLPGSP